MKRRTPNAPRIEGRKRVLSLKLLNGVIITFVILFFIVAASKSNLKNLSYFLVKDILAKGIDSINGPYYYRGARPPDLSYLKGRSIFNIDLNEEAKQLSQLYPAYKKIRLVRILPNRIFADFVIRKPLAVVKLYRYFLVDEDALLFDTVADIRECDLPVISGLETKLFGPKPGKVCSNTKELILALRVIKEARGSGLKDYKIKTVDVTNAVNASFSILDNLEIKIGENDIKNKMGILKNLLIQAKNDLRNIKYIDLRFKEPLIKFKDAK